MAIYRFEARVLKRSEGPSAFYASAYRAGARLVNSIDGRVADYSSRKRPIHEEILAPPGVPEWVYERSRLWSEAEAVERRRDAQLARKLQLAMPAELTNNQQIQLVREFVKDQCVAFGMIADVTIHRPPQGGDPRNIHAHVLLTTRNIRINGFCLKNRDWNSRHRLREWRQQWAVYVNRALESAGHTQRIDHRKLEEQEKAPNQAPFTGEKKKNKAAPAYKKRFKDSEETKLSATIREVEQLKKEMEELKKLVSFQLENSSSDYPDIPM